MGKGPIVPSKNQNPREGIETDHRRVSYHHRAAAPSKNQNPREGIETYRRWRSRRAAGRVWLQKTKIPARGLKHSAGHAMVVVKSDEASKNQNPREGIETKTMLYICQYKGGEFPSKNQNPREGIETDTNRSGVGSDALWLQKTKIPARGLKR